MSAKHRVIFTDPHQHVFDGELLAELKTCNASFEARTCRDENELIEFCSEADAVLTSAARLTSRVIQSMRQCRIIARIGTGYDNVDHRAAGEAGIPVTNVPEFCTEDVATHAIALMLALQRQLTRLDRDVKHGNWRAGELSSARRLSRQVLGLVGFGAIGLAVATRAAGFGMKVMFYDPAYRESGDAPPAGAQRCASLAALLAEADVVSLHVPLIPQTRGMIGEREFRAMKPGAILVNTSRGAIVVEADLVRALKEGRIGGAALDVLESEPPRADHPLLKMDNVILSPHCAAHSVESLAEVRRRAVEEVIRALRGEPLRHVVNQEFLG